MEQGKASVVCIRKDAMRKPLPQAYIPWEGNFSWRSKFFTARKHMWHPWWRLLYDRSSRCQISWGV